MKQRKVRVHMHFEREAFAAITNLAKQAGCSRSEWIRRALEPALRDAAISILAQRPNHERG